MADNVPDIILLSKVIDTVASKYTNFSDSYEARKTLYDIGFTTDFIQGVYDEGYSSAGEFDSWFKTYDKTITKDSKIYKLLKTTYMGGVENFKMNHEFDKIAQRINPLK